MPKFEKGSEGYWAGKSRKGLETHPAMEFECKTCSAKFKRSHYAYKKGLENPKLMPKFCCRACQFTGNQLRVGKPPGKTAYKKGDTRLVGENNPNWKGGSSPIASKVRKLNVYAEWRRAVYERDDHTCTKCGVRGGYLNADHIKLFHKILEDNKIKTVTEARACGELWDISNGQTLCRPCHKEKTTSELDHVYQSKERMRGLNRAGGTPGRKWKRDSV